MEGQVMEGFLFRWIVNALALLVTTYIIKGIEVDGIGAALVAALVLGVVNTVLKPILLFFTLPFNILSLGLLTFVINGLLLILVSKLVPGFDVKGLFAAIVGSIVLSVISSVINGVFK
jgi:putative membrane protein